jgi:EAL domain-containing protein (putative c-di-GMP-specific phosphodiesterase class I)
VERLGLIERIDRSVLWTVIGLLRRHPHVSLGCNVSAQSLKHGRWWHRFCDALQERPDLACRLIIEVTRTSAITEDADAIDILQGLQALGCKIAISDMGLGYNTLDFVITSHPDFIKIDRGRLGAIAGETPESSLRLFGNLVRLCADLTPCVVATGIEVERARTEAVATGVHALQGYLFGRPNVLPSWVGEAAVVRDAFEPDRSLSSPAATREAQRNIFLASTRTE